MDFLPLQHIRGAKVYLTQACQPATFRPQGLVTLSTVYSLRTRAGFVSRRQRSWGSLPFEAFPFGKVIQHISEPDEPTYRFS